MKYCLIVSVASLMVVCPCASANKNADPHRHAHSQSHHQEGQTRKNHGAVAGSKQSTSNENAQLAKLERQTAQIHSAPPKKTPKPSISAARPQERWQPRVNEFHQSSAERTLHYRVSTTTLLEKQHFALTGRDYFCLST
jgi:hypothetical protein